MLSNRQVDIHLVSVIETENLSMLMIYFLCYLCLPTYSGVNHV